MLIDWNDSGSQILEMDCSVDARGAGGGDDIVMGHSDPRIVVGRPLGDHAPRSYPCAVVQCLCLLVVSAGTMP